MAFFVEPPIALSLDFSKFPTRNDSYRLLLLDQFQNVVHAIPSIGNYSLACEIHFLKHFIAFHTVVAIAGGQFIAYWIAKRIYDGMNFGRYSASGASDGLEMLPPFAPAPCWWTRTMVASIMICSKSGAMEICFRISSHTPASCQRRKRV